MITILIIGGLPFIFDISTDYPTAAAINITVNDDGGADYTTIQQAIDNANVGDTIYVWEGTYKENIIINKAITLIGNGTSNTTIDGKQNGDVVNITSNWVNITGFTITNSTYESSPDNHAGIELNNVENVHIYNVNCSNNYNGIFIINSKNNTIENNSINWNNEGIYLYNSNNNMINNNSGYLNNDIDILTKYSNLNSIINNNISCIFVLYSNLNNITNNTCVNDYFGGIFVWYSNMTIIKNNTLISCGLWVDGHILSHWNTHYIENNTNNEKPIYYWKNTNGGKIPSNAGQVILANCTNIIVENQNVSNGIISIELGFSMNNIIKNNTCNLNLFYGIYMFYSNSNIIFNNNCSNNWHGIIMEKSNSNNIIKNTYNSNSNEGIYIIDSDLNNIINNSCSNNKMGILTWDSNLNSIINNTCNLNNLGIEIYMSNSNNLINNTFNLNNRGITVPHSNLNTIINNTCNFNKEYGIYLINSSQHSVESNNISNNQYGIRLDSNSNSNYIFKNVISYNSIMGISIGSDPSNNIIYHNDIILNTQQANDNGNNFWNNSNQEGNYWSDYTGLDNGANGRTFGDGIGDTNIPHLNIDHYPFTNRSGWLYPGLPILIGPDNLDTDGNYTISWNKTARAIGYILEEDTSNIFDSPTELYNGSELIFELFMKSEDNYYYRLKAYSEWFESDWSNIVNVTVDFLPIVPQNFQVSVFPMGNTLNLSWDLNHIDTKEYDIYYKNETINQWTFLDNIPHPVHTYNHTNLTDGTRYYYKVQAKDFRGQVSNFSSVVSAVPIDTMAPQTPTGLTAYAVSDSEIELSWAANPELDLAGYMIYMNDTSAGINGSFKINYTIYGKATSHMVSGLTEQVTYYFKLVAFDEVPNFSSFSSVVFATPPDLMKPNPPTGLTVSEASYKNLTLLWNASPESDVVGYNLYRSLLPFGPFNKVNSGLINGTQYIDEGLNESTIYYYIITAVDDAGFESEFSNKVYGVTILAPYPPQINNSISDLEIPEDGYDDSINLYFWFIDINNDPLTFRCEGQVNIEVTIYSSNGTVILQPKKDWNGEETLIFYCSDGISEISDNVTITVYYINDPPGPAQIIKPKDKIKITEGEPLEFESICDDADIPYGDKLTFKWISSELGVIDMGQNLTNIYLGVGTHLITLEVTDNYGEISIAKVRVTVLKKPEEHESKGENYTNLIIVGFGVIFIVIILMIILFIIIKKKKGPRKEVEKEEAVQEKNVIQPPGIYPEETEEEEPKIKSSVIYEHPYPSKDKQPLQTGMGLEQVSTELPTLAQQKPTEESRLTPQPSLPSTGMTMEASAVPTQPSKDEDTTVASQEITTDTSESKTTIPPIPQQPPLESQTQQKEQKDESTVNQE